MTSEIEDLKATVKRLEERVSALEARNASIDKICEEQIEMMKSWDNERENSGGISTC